MKCHTGSFFCQFKNGQKLDSIFHLFSDDHIVKWKSSQLIAIQASVSAMEVGRERIKLRKDNPVFSDSLGSSA